MRGRDKNVSIGVPSIGVSGLVVRSVQELCTVVMVSSMLGNEGESVVTMW